MDKVNGIFSQYIGRWVAWLLTPLLTVASGAAAVWANKHLGLTLTGGQLTGFVVTVVTGVAVVGYRWIANRGEFEKLVLELEKLYEAGQNVDPGPAPTERP